MIRCGFYENDITPRLGLSRPGHLVFSPAFEVADLLSCSCAVFGDDDGIKQVFVSADVIQVPISCSTEARSRISELLSVGLECIMVCATHTHEGGPVEKYGDERNYDEDYCKFLTERIVDCAVLASKRMKEVKIGYAHCFDEDIANYRVRVLPDGTVKTFAADSKPYGRIDPEISCIVVDNTDGSHCGVLVNYACHACCVGEAVFSSDFPGALRDALREHYGRDFSPIFLNGFLGNINHVDYENNTHDRPMYYRLMGRKLACEIAAAIEDTTYFADPKLRSVGKTITVKTRAVTPEKLAWAKSQLPELDNMPTIPKLAVTEALYVHERGVLDYDLHLQVHKLGGINLFATPRELFIEFQHRLKAASDSKMNLCVALANGECSYVPTKELIAEPGCFEATLNRFSLEEATGDRIVETLLDMMHDLR